MQLHELKPPRGAHKKKRIVGRGPGSGRGKTSGRGQTGQKSRSGHGMIPSLEGGQMPLIRRLPKVGFNSKRPVLFQIVHLDQLNRFDKGTVINAEVLKTRGLIKSERRPVKILADGEIKKSLVVKISHISQSAREKILKAGGTIEEAGIRNSG